MLVFNLQTLFCEDQPKYQTYHSGDKAKIKLIPPSVEQFSWFFIIKNLRPQKNPNGHSRSGVQSRY